MKRLAVLFVLIISHLAFAGNTPESWYKMPEERSALQLLSTNNSTIQKENTEELEKSVDAIFEANQNAIESSLGGEASAPAFDFSDKPKDWVPWRAEYFTTDLSLTVGGLLGVLATKGTATVRGYWRKQNPPSLTALSHQDEGQSNVIAINEYSTKAEITQQIDSAINVAVKANKVPNTPTLREELMVAANDFQILTQNLSQTDKDLPWWVQRFRIDFSVDAQGHVHTNVTVGGEVRFRFEWHRIKRKQAVPIHSQPKGSNRIANLEALKTFVRNMSEDLDHAFAEMPEHGFQAHTIRMGLGISVKGDIGVVKGGAGVVGQIYFTRNVARPTKYPDPKPIVANNDSLHLIQQAPSPSQLSFAKRSKIRYQLHSLSAPNLTSPIQEVVYKVQREQFRKGLKKAAGISEFFAKRAAKQKGAGWKIYELRTAFDASVGGELTMATLTGAVTAQISFFNQNF